MRRITDLTCLPLYSVAATRRMEQAAQRALAPHTLMRRAGLAAARLALALAPHARTVWLACGPGNNGGDGLEAAMRLQTWGMPAVVTWLGDADHLPDDARQSLQRARAAQVRFADEPPARLDAQDLCVDALLGIGADRAPQGRMADWLARMHASAAAVLALDVPTGLNADTGHIARPLPAPRAARHTLSLLTAKPGLFTAHGRDACGQVWFDDLGAPAALPAAESPVAWLGAPSEDAAWSRPARAHASHKGSFGDVAVIGGESSAARGTAMTGAAWLAASAALHAGAGRVYVSLLPDEANEKTMNGPAPLPLPELMLRRFAALDLSALTLVCGCGGGQAVQALLPAVLRNSARLVLDADALNALAASAPLQAATRQRSAHGYVTVLTPHPLEAARLLGCSVSCVQQDRLAAARALAAKLDAVLVLKGSGTVIATPGQPPCINPTGCARLATPGTGDVLAGLIGARLAAGASPWDAACQAVWQHGALADHWPAWQPLTASALASRLCS